ncbi:MAG TPA: hypothetical protein VHQ47_10450 [Phycisphaerae bacterium]|nr:hypothetical protein [Phycisphaerae bacterium]
MHTRVSRRFGQLMVVAGLMAVPFVFTGCWFFAASREVNGEKIPAQYTGLANQSVAIVVYADQASTDEFPNSREEIANFLTAAFHSKMPSVRLLDPREVMNWQDDTLNWNALEEKDIGKHFSTDRVLYIELLDYSTRANQGFGDLQGHIRADCKVFETDSPGDSAAWSGVIDVRWPKDRPLDPTTGSEVAVRKRVLEEFSNALVNCFMEHRQFDESIREQEE